MRFYKIIKDDYIVGIGTGCGGIEITVDEYENILSIIRNKPIADAGYDYNLGADMTWDLVEIPMILDETIEND